MRKRISVAFLALCCFASCSEEEMIPTEDIDSVKAIGGYGPNGQILRAGYGFNQLTFETYDSPIDKPLGSVFQTNNFPNGTRLEFAIVDDEKIIENVLSREDSFEFGFNQPADANPGVNVPSEEGGIDNGESPEPPVGPGPPVEGPVSVPGGGNNITYEEGRAIADIIFGEPDVNDVPQTPPTLPEPPSGPGPAEPAPGEDGNRKFPTFADVSFSVSAREFFAKNISSNQRSISVIGRVTIPIRKDEVLKKRPRFSQEAREDLKTGVYTFMDNYGPAWVTSEISAIEVYHVFNFISDVNESGEEEIDENGIGIAVRNFFGFNTSRSLTRKESISIRKSYVDSYVLTNLVNYTPLLVTQNNFNNLFLNGKYKDEIDKMRAHARANPLDLKPYRQTLAPHADPFTDKPDQGRLNRLFRAEFSKMGRCNKNLDDWTALEARLTTVQKKSKRSDMRRRATQALVEVRSQISAARECSRRSRAPRKNRFIGITIK